MAQVRSGEAVFRADENNRVRDWNVACERLTGIPAAEAEGRHCWDVVAGRDASGATVCHPGCSVARLAQQGWPVSCTDLQMRTRFGRKRMAISTIVVREGARTTVLHPLRETVESAEIGAGAGQEPRLTRRQREILYLLVEGVRVKQIAERLTLAESTVRNHVRAILRELEAHSQLEAVARARSLSLALEEPAA
jgi:DNA-binding CsgD family transcriptional regulator